MPFFNFLPIEVDPPIPGKTVFTAVNTTDGKGAPVDLELRLVAVPFEQFQKKDVSSAIAPVGSSSPRLQVQSDKGERNYCKSRDKDWISKLPDEVIVDILSKLPLKQAGKTSVLSKRWRYLWTYLTDLDFEDYDSLSSLLRASDSSIRINKYVNWVNRVLYASRTLHLNSLRIHYTVFPPYSCNVNNWFNFAMTTKQVKHLYLNMGTYASDAVMSGCYLKPISCISRNENLQSLFLACVMISDQLLDSILPHCPNLERLSLSHCRGFSRLKLVPSSSGSKNKLKHLLLRHFSNGFHVEIYAPNLTSFTLAGWASHDINVLHVPNLTEVAFGGSFCISLLENLQGSFSGHTIKHLGSFLSFFSQLHKVSLAACKQVRYSSSALGAVFGNLKQLELVVQCYHNCVLLTSFIEACPLLETFKLKFSLSMVLESDRNEEETAKLKHQHKKLKTIEYVGVLGSESSVKLALCLTNQALFLETFRLEGCLLYHNGERPKPCGNQDNTWLSFIAEGTRSLTGKIRRTKPQVNVVIV